MPKITETKKELRKQIILKSAMELFSSKGFVRTSMDDIVKHSGISKGGIYVYFRTKEDIFLHLANGTALKRHSILNDFSDDMSYSDRITFYLQKAIKNFIGRENHKKSKFIFEFWVEYKDKKKLGHVSKKEFLQERYEFFANDLKQLITGGINAGEFRRDIDLDLMIYIILSSIDGIAFFEGIMDKNIPENLDNFLASIYNNFLLNK